MWFRSRKGEKVRRNVKKSALMNRAYEVSVPRQAFDGGLREPAAFVDLRDHDEPAPAEVREPRWVRVVMRRDQQVRLADDAIVAEDAKDRINQHVFIIGPIADHQEQFLIGGFSEKGGTELPLEVGDLGMVLPRDLGDKPLESVALG